jgi:hypothetical protein
LPITLVLGAACVVGIFLLTTWLTVAVSRPRGAVSLLPPFAPLSEIRLAPGGVRLIAAFETLVYGGLGVLVVNAALGAAWWRLSLPLTLLGLLLLVLRAFRIAPVLDDEGVEIKNYWRTSRFRWEDVVSIRSSPVYTHAPSYGSRPNAIVFDTRTSGSTRSQATEG